MTSELTTDIVLACSDEVRRGGVKNVWFQYKDNVTSFTAGGTDLDFNAVTMDSTADKWLRIDHDFESATFSLEGNKENGSNVQNVTGAVELGRLEKVKAGSLNKIVNNCDVVVIAESYDGKAFVYGYDELLGTDAALRTTLNETREGPLEGVNGYTLNFEGKTAEPTREFTGTIETNSDGSKDFS